MGSVLISKASVLIPRMAASLAPLTKKSPGGTRLRRGVHTGRGGFRASACAATLQHRPYTNLTPVKRQPNKSTSVLARQHFHVGPPTPAAAGGGARRSLPAVACGLSLC